MRVLVTGATGFAGRWLVQELLAAGHAVVKAPGRDKVDLAGSPDLMPLIHEAQPDAVAHLAALAFLPEAEADPNLAERVNAGGTRALFKALDAAGSTASVLVTSTADVYSRDAPAPIDELADVAPGSAYGRSKLAQEQVAAAAVTSGRPVTIARAFNHIGPGQRPVFVVPALARRVLELKSGRTKSIAVGNLFPRRDFSDVRDVVWAYRLLIERMARSGSGVAHATIVNVGSGRSVAIEAVLQSLCSIAGVEPRWHVDESLVRSNEVADRFANIKLLQSLVPWEPRTPLETSLRDVLASTSV